DGKWYTKYILGPVFVDTDEISAADQEAAYKAQRDAQQATAVRQDRNRKMAESDWTQLPDSPVDKAVWATYRQALRDVPVQAGFPWNVDWPTQPE
ncbi:MAG: tail fiber assembly protein, partial [bacterium]